MSAQGVAAILLVRRKKISKIMDDFVTELMRIHSTIPSRSKPSLLKSHFRSHAFYHVQLQFMICSYLRENPDGFCERISRA
mmetsp:Transcript_8111/g.13112  ORF Transcript_8111/g.13112 Transcript_8111/m.13112 type:complete len:81 (-) Transcript_8111:1037-1279(-)